MHAPLYALCGSLQGGGGEICNRTSRNLPKTFANLWLSGTVLRNLLCLRKFAVTRRLRIYIHNSNGSVPPNSSTCYQEFCVRSATERSWNTRGYLQSAMFGHLCWLSSCCTHISETATTPRPPCNLLSGRSPSWGGGGGRSPSDGPPQPQSQCNLKKNVLRRLRRLVFPMLFGSSDGPLMEGGDCKGWGITRGAGGTTATMGRRSLFASQHCQSPTDPATENNCVTY